MASIKATSDMPSNMCLILPSSTDTGQGEIPRVWTEVALWISEEVLSATPATAPPTTETTARLVRRVGFYGLGVVGLRAVGIGCHLGSNRLRLRFVGFVGNLRLGRDNYRFLGGNFSSHRLRLLTPYCRLMNLAPLRASTASSPSTAPNPSAASATSG